MPCWSTLLGPVNKGDWYVRFSGLQQLNRKWMRWFDENKIEMDFIRNQTGRCCYKDRSTTAVGRPSSVRCLLPAFRPKFSSCKEEDIGSSLSQTQYYWSSGAQGKPRFCGAVESTWASSRRWFFWWWSFIFQHHFHFHLFIAMFAATMFLAGQCLYRMTRSLQRPLLVQFFQRMSWSMTRPLLGFSGSSELCWKMYQLKQMAVVIKQSDCWIAESKCLNNSWANVME